MGTYVNPTREEITSNGLVEWGDYYIDKDDFDSKLETATKSGNTSIYGVNGSSSVNRNDFNKIAQELTGIFGMPYQFSEIVDPVIETVSGSTKSSSNIGRKFNEKIFSVMPVLFLTPGEPKFMSGYGKKAKSLMAGRLIGSQILGGDNDNEGAEFDDGRYYSFTSNFVEYKKYANVALRALALYMGIEDVSVPVPGTSKMIKLGNIDVENFMNNEFTKLFGSQCVVPFFVDANTSSNESFSNSTTESVVGQTVNGFSSTAREIKFMMGAGGNGIIKSIGSAVTDVSGNILSSLGDLSDVVAGDTMISRITNELTTIVTGGKIVFPEIWSDSSYSKSYDVSLRLRSPDPDPVSIFLNIYLPIILLISMTAPRQIGNSSNSFEAPFLVRATYKSIFSCDLGIIESLSIDKGGQSNWNVMGHPITADVSVSIKDLYESMFISKRMGLLTNTAQMDYLATLAGTDLNEYEPLRMIKLWAQILGDTPRDWASDLWGGVKQKLNSAASGVLGKITDTRFLR